MNDSEQTPPEQLSSLDYDEILTPTNQQSTDIPLDDYISSPNFNLSQNIENIDDDLLTQ